MKHFALFDIIRGVSAFLIVLYHYTTRYNENPLFSSARTNWCIDIPWGCAAVTTFFILSGYLGAKNLTSGASSPIKTLYKRLRRLFPTFWCAVILTSLWMFLFFKPAAPNFSQMLVNFSMIPALLHVRPVDGAYWTLQYELIFALFMFVFMLLKNMKVIGLSWITGSIVLSFIAADNSFFSSLSVLLMANYSHAFLGGMMLYAIHQDKSDMVSVFILVLCVLNQFLWGFSIAHNIFYIVTLVLIWFVVPCEKCINRKNISIRVIVWVATISYPLYLIHQMIGFSIIYYLQLVGCKCVAYIVVPISVSVLIAYLIHKYVELPFSKDNFNRRYSR